MVADREPSRQLIRVLLVEDDAGDAMLVEELLAEVDAPIRLTRAVSLTAAKPLLAGQDCVLLDLGLPDASGLQAVRELKEADDKTALVVLTGLADAGQGVAAVAAGAQDYLVKGQVDGDLLARVLRYAVERARSEEVHRQLRDERLLAMEKGRLERGLLPTPVLNDDALHVQTRYAAGRERMLLGGDFYDVVETDDGTVHAIVGDVCGHGPDEAALGVCLRVAWRAMVIAGRPVPEVLDTMQRVLVHERHLDGLFATASMLSVAPDRRTARLHLAGHPPPVLWADNKSTLLSAPVGVPLGVLPGANWVPATIDLGDDWSVLMYTDGLIEGRVDDSAERLGADRLVQMVCAAASAGPGWQRTVLDDLVRDVCVLNDGDLVDDVATLLITRVR
ncbi:Response regulator receiver domain-containing protein [Actinokineospora alba]|uniref:Response regulator receiver domain-containing protein n=1 Tax=Actinokineospora alba TaxID=504798 RepID=A0A1H0GMM4_9PSEU|nr:SpoIIE family protein phosphatase [Actinokineospora alba]TDP69951.1 response regulator receiver domain-containing protein [Actinokineospora alba]SDO07931.1 Response regulator receiver domain-containing protein [Actinokineospora alba]